VKWHTENEELAGAIEKHSDSITKKTILYELVRGTLDDNKTYDVEREFEMDRGKKIQIAVRK
jgi:hypothetical protein